ncbi:MAG: GIY-YIG nuclease family protein [Bacteroidia bacterium]|nr:GIY-YIG nuclease family protein [Bacteroidia bacterium]
MHFVYILYSESADKYYVGETEDVVRRFSEHNQSERKQFTSPYRPWILKAVFVCEDRFKARKAEDFIKKQKSRRFIQKIIQAERLYGELAVLCRINFETLINQR